MKKPGPILQVFEYGPLVVEVSMLSSHRDYRVWNAWFGKKGSRQRFWSSFRLDKGIWFGPMAYYVVARTVTADVELAQSGVKVGLHQEGFPQIQQVEMYRQRLEYLLKTLSWDDLPKIYEAINQDDQSLSESEGKAEGSLHNARRMILENRVPDHVTLFATSEHDLEVIVRWDNGITWALTGFKYGKFSNLEPTITFFRMIGYYMSDEEFRRIVFVIPRRGPKEWSPHRQIATLERGRDYGVEDFQPGEHDL